MKNFIVIMMVAGLSFQAPACWHGISDTLDIISIEYSDQAEDSSSILHIFYPQINDNSDNEIIKKINVFLEGEFKQSVSWFEESISDTFQMEEEYEFTYSFETGFTVAFNSSEFISIVMDHYQFTGGAHGNYYSLGYNIRISDGTLLTLGDLIDENSFELLTYECEQSILSKYEASSLYEAGLFEDEISVLPDQDFYIIPGALVLQFDPYEIAPYALGEISAEIPFDRINDILKTGIPFKTK